MTSPPLYAHSLPFRDYCFDNVVSIETLEHLSKPQKFLKEITRILKPCGIFIVSTPNKLVSSFGEKPLIPAHIREFNIKEFYELLEGYFENIDIYLLFPQSRLRFYLRYTQHFLLKKLCFLPIKTVKEKILT